MPSVKRGPRKPAPPARIKVSQGTIDKIKGMGMQAALKKAARPSTSGDFVEGVKRMYGARRLTAAQGQRADKRIQKPGPAKPKKVTTAKSADEARARGNAGANTVSKKASTKGKGMFPGLLTGNYKGKKITRGKVSGPGYFKS